MNVITTINELRQRLKQERKQGKTIGFVPTMGYLHEGHLALMQRARNENDLVVASIFVNPLQFGPKEDLSTYPRDFTRDSALAEEVGVDVLFYPSVEEMYKGTPSVTVKVHARTDVLCGKSRPGHFDGVATVLTKLFHIVGPDKAYFGIKDAQQLAVVESLVNDFNFPLEIIPVETVRESDGLAKSSRNVKLLPEERKQASVLYASLQHAKEAIEKGERDLQAVVDGVRQEIGSKCNGVVDYIDIYTYPSLQPLSKLEGRIIIALAVKFTHARLIDNLILTI